MGVSSSLIRRLPVLQKAYEKRDRARRERDAALAERDAAIAERDAIVKRLEGPKKREAPPIAFGRTMDALSQISALRCKPWYSIDLPAEVARADAMIHANEQRLLYTLARDHFMGEGRIIDGGAYLGASSLALGWGLRDRGYPAIAVIDAFDTFVIDDFSVRHCFNKASSILQAVNAGDNVRFVYDHNIAPVKSVHNCP